MKTRTINMNSIWNLFLCHYANIGYWNLCKTDICQYTRWWIKAVVMCLWTFTWMTAAGIAGIALVIMFGCAFIDVLGLGTNFLDAPTFDSLLYSILVGATGVGMTLITLFMCFAFIIIVIPETVKSIVQSVKDMSPDELPMPVEMYRSWKDKYCFKITTEFK